MPHLELRLIIIIPSYPVHQSFVCGALASTLYFPSSISFAIEPPWPHHIGNTVGYFFGFIHFWALDERFTFDEDPISDKAEDLSKV